MGAYYFDSSALVKRYAQEVGSPWVGSLTDTGTQGPRMKLAIYHLADQICHRLV